MYSLKIFENGLIKVYQNDRQEQIVNARELHDLIKN